MLSLGFVKYWRTLRRLRSPLTQSPPALTRQLACAPKNPANLLIHANLRLRSRQEASWSTANGGGVSFRYLDMITAGFVAVLLISNIATLKVFEVAGQVFDGGALIFPLSYIFGDILTEVYGYQKSRRVIWQGLFWLIVYNLVLSICIALPAEPEWDQQIGQDALVRVFSHGPRIALAGVIAFFWGEFCNSYVMARMKVHTAGRHLALRTVTSTVLGQLVDTALFCIIAFGGVLSPAKLANYIVVGYVYKVAVEVIMTPLTCWTVGYLKETEQYDADDTATDFNPFKLA